MAARVFGDQFGELGVSRTFKKIQSKPFPSGVVLQVSGDHFSIDPGPNQTATGSSFTVTFDDGSIMDNVQIGDSYTFEAPYNEVTVTSNVANDIVQCKIGFGEKFQNGASIGGGGSGNPTNNTQKFITAGGTVTYTPAETVGLLKVIISANATPYNGDYFQFYGAQTPPSIVAESPIPVYDANGFLISRNGKVYLGTYPLNNGGGGDCVFYVDMTGWDQVFINNPPDGGSLYIFTGGPVAASNFLKQYPKIQQLPLFNFSFAVGANVLIPAQPGADILVYGYHFCTNTVGGFSMQDSVTGIPFDAGATDSAFMTESFDVELQPLGEIPNGLNMNCNAAIPGVYGAIRYGLLYV